MEAEYTVIKDGIKKKYNDSALAVGKCIQIHNLGAADKRWNGYKVMDMQYGILGLRSITIKYMPKH